MSERRTTLKRPMDARGAGQICEMPRDNLTAGDFWILTDGFNVSIAAQKTDESATVIVSIPRGEFNRMVRWYTKPVKVRKVKP